MNVVLKIITNAAPDLIATPEFDGKYIVSFADTPDGHGVLRVSGKQSEAKVFATSSEAIDFWRQPSSFVPLRPDGEPNRPLTAFTIEIEALHAQT